MAITETIHGSMAPDPIDSPLAKVRRAYAYIRRFQRETETTRRGKFPFIDVKKSFDSTDNTYVLTITRVDPVPLQALLLLDEAAHHLRSALDHLVFALALADSGAQHESTQFPILTNPDDWDKGGNGKRTQERWLAGLSQAHREAIKNHQPYQPWRFRLRVAEHPLKTLNDLNNDNKHRLVQGAYPTFDRVIVSPGVETGCQLHPLALQEGVFDPAIIGQPLQPNMEIARVPVVVMAPEHNLELGIRTFMYVAFRNGIACANLLQSATYIRKIICEFSDTLRDAETVALWRAAEGRFQTSTKDVVYLVHRQEVT